MDRKERKRGISGYNIKIIAIITMIIDHIGYMMTWVFPQFGERLYFLYRLLRTIGRISFPLFCFLLVEGFIHTRDIKKYGFKLFLFALISELPYDLAFFGKTTFQSQNVFFTLFIGLLVIGLMNHFSMNYTIQGFIYLIGCGLSIVLKSDYSWMGITIIVILYYFRNDRLKKILIGGPALIYSSLSFGYGMAVLALIPIWFYNGEKGRDYIKYFFYWFYPVHLTILYCTTFFISKL